MLWNVKKSKHFGVIKFSFFFASVFFNPGSKSLKFTESTMEFNKGHFLHNSQAFNSWHWRHKIVKHIFNTHTHTHTHTHTLICSQFCMSLYSQEINVKLSANKLSKNVSREISERLKWASFLFHVKPQFPTTPAQETTFS